MPVKRKRRVRSGRTGLHIALVAIPLILLLVSHALFLAEPLYWDELGHFVPAALDLFRAGHWIPESVPPNAHPPGLPVYLSSVWTLTGYSIPATRLAMLLMAGVSLVVVFLLAAELCRDLPAAPVMVTLAVGVSPLFFSQAMLAQLDLPAMLFTSLAVWLFLKNKFIESAIACVVLVLFKETGVIVPLILGAWLAVRGQFLPASMFAAAPLVLGAWFLLLKATTGHVFGNIEFSSYNAVYLMHPVRATVALARRLYYLFVADLRWIGTIGVAFGLFTSAIFVDRRWGLAGLIIAGHVVLFSLFGGAMLERYLLPVLPLVYAAMIAGWSAVPMPWQGLAQLALLTGLAVNNFWNPPYPFPYENNLAFADFIELQREAARYLEEQHPGSLVTTAWPLTAALSHPDYGYVRFRHQVEEIPDFSLATLVGLRRKPPEVLVTYSKEWTATGSLMRFPLLQAFWRKFFGYAPPAINDVPRLELGLHRVANFTQNGQWIEIWVP